MKLCLNTEECKKREIPMDVMFYLASLYFSKLIDSNTFQQVCSKGFIEFDGFNQRREPINARLTQNGIDMVESILLDSEFNDDEGKSRFDILADKLQEIYPEGKKPGTKLMWRDSTPIISKKLKVIVKKYGVKFTDEQAIEATKRYVNSFNGDYQFMQVLKYFISKRNTETGEETSQLLSYIENDDSESVNTNWMDNIR